MLDMILLKNKAQTFAEKLLQEHNDMIYEFSNKASKMLIESLQQHINNKYASAQSNVIDNDTVRLFVSSDASSINFAFGGHYYYDYNWDYKYSDHLCYKLNDYNYKVLSNTESYKKLGLVYSISSLIITHLEQLHIPNIYNINLDIKSDYNNSSKQIYFDIAFWGDISIYLTYETLNRFRTL